MVAVTHLAAQGTVVRFEAQPPTGDFMPFVGFVMACVLVACIAAFYWSLYSAHQGRLFSRMTDLGADKEARRLRRKSFLLQVGDRFDRTRWARNSIEPALDKADLLITPSEWVVAVALLWVLAYLAVRLIFETTTGVNLVTATGTALLLPRSYMKSRQNHYLASFEAQMADVAVLMGNSLRAGLSVPQSFGVISQKLRRPAGIEFGRAYRELRLGLPAEQVMKRMMVRLPCEELALMITTILIQRRAGGDLAHAMMVMAEAITARFKLKDEIRTMTAEAKFTGLILVFLPLATLALVNRMMPGAVANFLAAPVGWVVMALFIGINATSYFLIGKVSAIEV